MLQAIILLSIIAGLWSSSLALKKVYESNSAINEKRAVEICISLQLIAGLAAVVVIVYQATMK